MASSFRRFPNIVATLLTAGEILGHCARAELISATDFFFSCRIIDSNREVKGSCSYIFYPPGADVALEEGADSSWARAARYGEG